MKRSFASSLLVFGFTWLASTAHAQETVTSPRAQELFDQGLAAARAGNLAKACPLFRASHDAEPRTGTLLNLANCYEKNWQTASAWAAYREAEALAGRENRPELAEQAKQKRTVLEPRLVRLTVKVPKKVSGLVVKHDGVAFADAELNLAMPLDPGEHLISAEAPGYERWEQRVLISNKSRDVSVPELQRPKAPSWWTTGRKVGVGVGAAGVVALATGTVLGLVANGKYQAAKDTCQSGTTECAEGASADADSARSMATPATVLFVAGAAMAVGGGALILFSKPKRQEPARAALVPTRVALDVSPGWLGLSGQFE